jgi:hypothetical protein
VESALVASDEIPADEADNLASPTSVLGHNGNANSKRYNLEPRLLNTGRMAPEIPLSDMAYVWRASGSGVLEHVQVVASTIGTLSLPLLDAVAVAVLYWGTLHANRYAFQITQKCSL